MKKYFKNVLMIAIAIGGLTLVTLCLGELLDYMIDNVSLAAGVALLFVMWVFALATIKTVLDI